jgi:hypothetical protein
LKKGNVFELLRASPDLYVKTPEGEVKIDLNNYGKFLPPQQKIKSAAVTVVSKDSIDILFTKADTTTIQITETIGINIKKAIESLVAK